MITHAIEPYATPTPVYQTPAATFAELDRRRKERYGKYVVGTKPTKHWSKFAYTCWLDKLVFARSCYVVKNATEWPHKPEDYFRVVQMQEVHWLLKWDEQERPLAMELVDCVGNRFWTNVEDWHRCAWPANAEHCFDLPQP